MMKNIFKEEVTNEVIERINKLSSESKAQWGKMNAGQVMAHCNVTYDYVYTDKYPNPNPIARFMIKLFAKNAVVSEKSYPREGRTGPDFIIKGDQNFEEERKKLIHNIKKTQELGEDYFDNKESHSFGKLTKQEWNNSFYKHLDHHLTQFGV